MGQCKIRERGLPDLSTVQLIVNPSHAPFQGRSSILESQLQQLKMCSSAANSRVSTISIVLFPGWCTECLQGPAILGCPINTVW